MRKGRLTGPWSLVLGPWSSSPPSPPGGGRKGILCLLLAAAAGCSNSYYLDLPDVDLDAPPDLSSRLSAFRSGSEKWHGDPRAVADNAIRTYLDVPWKADPFRAGLYEVRKSAEWGYFVVRGYRYPSGAVMRYRVKIQRHDEIWYPVQISRYKHIPDVPDEGMHVHEH